jgi:RNA polymerase sigma-70 factor, ECF subfamily
MIPSENISNNASFYAGLHDEILRIIRMYIPDSDDSKDVLQEVFIKIHTRIGQLKTPDKVHSWVYRITRNEITDFYRKRKNPDTYELTLRYTEEEPENEAEFSIGRSLRKLIEDMPEEDCDAFCLYELHDTPQQEIADLLGISYTAAKTRIHRTRKLIRDRLMECCHFEFDRYGRVVSYHQKACCCCNAG